MDQVLWRLLPSTGNCIILTTISIPVQKSLFPGDYSNRPSPGSLLTTLQSYLGRQSPPRGTHPQLTTPPASCRTAPQGRARPTSHPHLGPLPASVHTHTPCSWMAAFFSFLRPPLPPAPKPPHVLSHLLGTPSLALAKLPPSKSWFRFQLTISLISEKSSPLFQTK